MAGGAKAVASGDELAKRVCEMAATLGLEVREQFKVARRLWGAERRIDVILKDPKTAKTLGVECKFQGVGGTAEEKIPAIIQDIDAWPIEGLVVFSGQGFTTNMKSFLISTGKAIDLEDLEPWLRLYFGLSLDDK
jgi:hypothetical protein